MLALKEMFPLRFVGGAPQGALPFFPSAGGGVVTKIGFTQTIEQAAKRLGLPTASLDQMERITGHSMRPSGAQFLANLGLDTYTVQLLGRWGSNTVAKYIREAIVSEAAAKSRASRIAITLNHLVAEADLKDKGEKHSDEGVRAKVSNYLRQFERELTEELVCEVTRRVACRLRRQSRSSSASSSTSTASSSSAGVAAAPAETVPELGGSSGAQGAAAPTKPEFAKAWGE